MTCMAKANAISRMMKNTPNNVGGATWEPDDMSCFHRLERVERARLPRHSSSTEDRCGGLAHGELQVFVHSRHWANVVPQLCIHGADLSVAHLKRCRYRMDDTQSSFGISYPNHASCNASPVAHIKAVEACCGHVLLDIREGGLSRRLVFPPPGLPTATTSSFPSSLGTLQHIHGRKGSPGHVNVFQWNWDCFFFRAQRAELEVQRDDEKCDSLRSANNLFGLLRQPLFRLLVGTCPNFLEALRFLQVGPALKWIFGFRDLFQTIFTVPAAIGKMKFSPMVLSLPLHSALEHGFLTRPKFQAPRCLRPTCLLSKFLTRIQCISKASYK